MQKFYRKYGDVSPFLRRKLFVSREMEKRDNFNDGFFEKQILKLWILLAKQRKRVESFHTLSFH